MEKILRIVKLLSWNVAGRRRLHGQQVSAIASRKPDIVALQEVTAGTCGLFRKELPAVGLEHVLDSFEIAPDPVVLQGPRRCGQILASCWPLEPLSPTAFEVPWPERVLSAVIAAPAGEIEIHVTHIPPGSSNG